MAYRNTYQNIVEYKFSNKDFGSLKIPEPDGWNEDNLKFKRHSKYHGIVSEFSNNLKFKRHSKYHGIVSEFSNNLKFYNEAKDYIINVNDLTGLNSELILTKSFLTDKSTLQNPNTSTFKQSYRGYLDFSTIQIEEHFVTIKFSSSTLSKNYESRGNDDIEIERTTDLKGKTIDKININDMIVHPRAIQYISKFELFLPNKDWNGAVNALYRSTIAIPFGATIIDGNNASSPVQMEIAYNTNKLILNQTFEIDNCIYLDSPIDQDLDIDLDIKIDFYTTGFMGMSIYLMYLKDGASFTPYKITQLGSTILTSPNVPTSISYTGDVKYSINKGDSLCVLINTFSVDAFQGSAISLSFDPNHTSCIITDGDGALMGLTSGMWLRQFFEDLSDKNSRYKRFTISPKDLIESIMNIFNVGFGIKIINGTEIAIMEDLKYFYQQKTIIDLPDMISDVSIKYILPISYSSLEFGYKKPNDAVSLYAESKGLDEPNTINRYTTPLSKVKTKYDKTSFIRADSYGQAFATMKNKLEYGTTDTRYDTDIWILDMKKEGNTFTQKTWQDRFEIKPTGIYSPETATGLWFSPANVMFRHAWWFDACLQKNLNDSIIYSSSLSNSKLKTKLANESEISEDGSFIIGNLPKPRFISSEISFYHNIDDVLLNKIKETTKIDYNGVLTQIPNFYFKVKYLDRDNKHKTGYIKSIEPKTGKWVLYMINN